MKSSRSNTADLVALATAPVSTLAGIGPAAEKELGLRGIGSVADLVFCLPTGFDDLRAPLSVPDAVARAGANGGSLGPRVAVKGVVRSASMLFVRGRPAVRVLVGSNAPASAKEALVFAWWFFAARGILAAAKPGAPWVLVGRLAAMKRPLALAMSHPDILADEAALGTRPRYPRLGVAPARLGRAIASAVERVGSAVDPVPAFVAAREAMPPFAPLLERVHKPAEPPSPEVVMELYQRLAWGEAFAHAWERAKGQRLAEAAGRVPAAPSLAPSPSLVERLRIELGFTWTAGQTRAIGEVSRDLAQAEPMRRLLFGDVGSGKTAVVLAAAAQAVGSKAQVAILAPTAVLAEQYMAQAGALARATRARIALLTSVVKPSPRKQLLHALARGDIDVLIGTHALFADDVTFHRLGLVVVDEQQRLGVGERLSLVRKGEGGRTATRPHLLTLSATPIPRSLALALRGELATSTLTERPPGRLPITTQALARSAWDDAVMPEVRSAAQRGERVFVVCPRIGGKDDDAAADEDDDDAAPPLGPSCLERAEQLGAALGKGAVVLAHGALPAGELARAVEAFRRGDANVLVGTTVVEVGIDVPEATLMVIDGAEHFGLAQLHQLRGRVGRGLSPAKCLLVHDTPLDPPALARLDALVRLASGMDVARADLELRGGGDLWGTRQSGEGGFLYLDRAGEPPWLARVGDDVARIAERDPDLLLPEHLGQRLALTRNQARLAVREEAG